VTGWFSCSFPANQGAGRSVVGADRGLGSAAILEHGRDLPTDVLRHCLPFQQAHLTRRGSSDSVADGGTVSIMGVYGGFMDKFPIGSVMHPRRLSGATG